MFGKKRSDDVIGPSKGLMKWVNRFFRFVLYPFIHPRIFLGCVLLLVAAGVLIPLLVYKVSFKDMGSWYKELLLNSYQRTENIATPLKEKIFLKYKRFVGDDTRRDTIHTKQEEMVDYQVEVRGRRTAFSKADENDKVNVENANLEVKNNADGADINKDVEVAATVEPEENAENLSVKDNSERQVHFKHSDVLELTYLDKPERNEGRATVINANEILVGTKTVYLYGIYAQLGTENARKAAEYMMDNIDGKEVDCYIGAYTSADKATAICYFEGKSINHELVNKGFSQNVSLY